MQLNVSYNFKRLALKNDFNIRQYMIENGMNIMRDDEGDSGMEGALEIHQIHNIVRTSNRRLIAPPPNLTVSELRRNSTTSSVSGISTTILTNGCETNGSNSTNGNGSNGNGFVHPSKPFNVRPIQIKTEPIDPDYDQIIKSNQIVQTSPASNSSGISVTSGSNSNDSVRPKSPPMIVINGKVSKSPDKSAKSSEVLTKNPEKSPKKPNRLEVENPQRINTRMKEKTRKDQFVRNLRVIKRKDAPAEAKKKLKKR